MLKYAAAGLLCVCLLTAAVWAEDVPAVNVAPCALLYTPVGDTSAAYQLKADLLDLAIQGASMGVTGEGSANVATQFAVAEGPEPSLTTMVTLTDIRGQAGGQVQSAAGAQVVVLTMDRHAQVLDYNVTQQVQANTISLGADALAGLAVFALLPPLPVEPVAVDNTWKLQRKIMLRDSGEVSMKQQCRLVASTADEIVIESSGQGATPNLQAPNPFMPDQQMTLSNVQIVITKLRQVCDPQTLVVRSAECEATISFDGTTPDYSLPLAAKIKLQLAPAPVEPAAG